MYAVSCRSIFEQGNQKRRGSGSFLIAEDQGTESNEMKIDKEMKKKKKAEGGRRGMFIARGE